ALQAHSSPGSTACGPATRHTGARSNWYVSCRTVVMSTAPADGSLAVHELMTVSAICVAPPTRVRDALLLMERYGIRHLPVVEDGGVVGLVSKTDVREALGVAQQDQ